MKVLKYIFYTVLFFFTHLQSVLSNIEILEVSRRIKDYPINNYTYIYEDKDGLQLIDAIINNQKLLFTKNNNLDFGATESKYWTLVKIKNVDNVIIELVLGVSNPDLNELQYFEYCDSIKNRVVITGENKIFSNREFNNRNFVFNLKIKPGEIYSCYISSDNQGDANFLSLFLVEHDYFNEYESKITLFNGVIFGLLFFIIIFNTYLFTMIRDKIYFIYTAYVFFITFFLFNYEGYSYQLLWGNYPWWSNHSTILFLSLAVVFQTFFSQLLLETKKNNRISHTLFNVFIFIFIASSILSLISKSAILISLYLLWYILPLLMLLTIIVAIITLFKKSKQARYLLIALSFTFIGGIIFTLKDLGIIPTNIFILKSVEVGLVFETLILTFAVVDRFRSELKEKNTQLLLHQTELIIAREKAEESDRLKSSFLANMSHEIRTPMNAILGFSSLLPEPSISNEKKQFFCKIIEERTKDLLRIINDVLDISKIEVKQMSILESDGNLRDLFNQLYEYYKSMIENQDQKKNLKLIVSYEIPDEYSSVNMDFVRLNQIISNFIDNAIKFTKEGFVEFGCRKEENMLLFFVKDTGIGIPKEKQNIIFDRFRQADETTSKVYGGTGLGLSISKGLIELMQGEVWIESEENKGTGFYIRVPYRPANPVVEEACINQEKNDSLIKKLLIVEDDVYNTTFIQELLSKSSFVCRYVETGKDAIDEINKDSDFDMVLLDIRLPDINGKDVAKYIKARHPGIKIIAQSAYASDRDRKSCLESGCDGYISKPYDKHSLMNIIYRYLKN